MSDWIPCVVGAGNIAAMIMAVIVIVKVTRAETAARTAAAECRSMLELYRRLP